MTALKLVQRNSQRVIAMAKVFKTPVKNPSLPVSKKRIDIGILFRKSEALACNQNGIAVLVAYYNW